MALLLECGRGESGRGWHDSIQRGLSWGHPFVDFGCEDVNTRLHDFRHIQLVWAHRKVVQCGVMRGVAQLAVLESTRMGCGKVRSRNLLANMGVSPFLLS